MTILDQIRRTAEAIPARMCLRNLDDPESDLSYRGLLTKIGSMAETLKGLGVGPGDRVAFATLNSPEAITAFLATWEVGGVTVPIDPALPAEDLKRLLHTADARLVLVSEACFADQAAETFRDQPVRRLSEGLPLFEGEEAGDCPKVGEPESPDIATIMFTSGTNGDYKGVLLTHANLEAVVAQSHEAIGVTPTDRHLCLLPMHHIYGLVQVILLGLVAGVPNTFSNTRDPAIIMQGMKEVKPTLLCMVPAFLHAIAGKVRTEMANRNILTALLRLPGTRRIARHLFRPLHQKLGGRLKTFVTGGAALDPEVQRLLENLGFKIIVGYGLTETTGAATGDFVQGKRGGSGTIGKPYPAVAIRIDKPDHEGEGEICVSGPTVMPGYFRNPEATQRALIEGWLHTGDIGTIGPDGNLRLKGRLDEAINTASGEKVMPEQIEAHYRDLPGVEKIAIFGLPRSDGKADEIHAAMEVNRQTPRDLEQIIFQRAGQLPPHLRIQRTHRCEQIPTTNAGKVRRRLLRERYREKSESSQPTSNHARGELERWLVSRLAEFGGLNVKDIDPTRPFFEYGLDSLQATGLSAELGQRLNRELAPTLFWEFPTIRRLANHLTKDPKRKEETVAECQTTACDGVAIVGTACRLPGAVNSPDEFWKFLKDGRDPITTYPSNRGAQAKTETYGAFLEDIDLFDADYFNISAREAEMLDPQQRILLELTQEALANASIESPSLAQSATGVFVGASNTDYSQLIRQATEHGIAPAWAATGNALSALSGRLAYDLDLTGPCETIDTACSSSLVALHHACRAIQSGECDRAIVGGVNLIIDPAKTACFAEAGFMASDGRCKTFDAAADGYVRSEGGIVVVLKALSAATRDGDRVLGVVRASAVNHGGASNGLTAPNGQAQAALLRQALKAADLDPTEIDVIEAHGTGTALGDPIEIEAIRNVYHQRNKSGPLRIGSVKSNIGHLEPAAGLAGVLKMLLALQHEEIPANLHFNQPNPLLKLDDDQLKILDRHEPWPQHSRPRRAGVSAFGFTGTNGHVILEEAPAPRPPRKAETPRPVFHRKRHWIAPAAPAETSSPTLASVTTLLETALELASGRLEPDSPLIDLGVDSIAVLDAIGIFQKHFGVAVPIQKLYEDVNTPRAIAAYLMDRADKPTPAADKPSALPTTPTRYREPELSPVQQTFLGEFTKAYTRRTKKSKQAAKPQRLHLADPRAISGFAAYKKAMVYPIQAAGAEGAYLEDLDGNRYVDVALEFGVNLFGHHPAFLRQARAAYQKHPLPLATGNPLASETADLFCRLTGTERVTFLTTGSEAVMATLRVARAATGRQKIAMFRLSYHGNHDQVLADPATTGPAHPAVPGVNPGHLGDVITLDYGDSSAFEQLEPLRDQLAGVLVEPVQSRNPDLQPTAFLKKLRAFTEEAGVPLIFDEVITGFRCHPAGAQGLFGVKADLAVYGKCLSAGEPLAALAGTAQYMNWIDGGDWDEDHLPQTDRTFVGGTFNGHPRSLSVALAVLRELDQSGPALQEELNATTEAMTARLNAFFERENLPIQVAHFSSLFRFVTQGCDTDLFYAGLRHHGVYANEVRNCFLSRAHGPNEIEAIESAVRETARMLRAGGFLSVPRKRSKTADTKWLVPLRKTKAPNRRIIFFPHAGGGSSTYRDWAAKLPDGVEPIFVQLPGREAHANIPAIEDFDTLMPALLESLQPRLDLPFTFYGHSMGAVIAFEAARRLPDHLAKNLEALIVSAEEAPDQAWQEMDIAPGALSDEALIERLKVFGDMPKANGQVMDYWLPLIRADFQLCASYRFQPGNPLTCPISALAGDDDSTVSDMGNWATMTTDRFDLQHLPGGHFFIESASDAILATLTR